MVYRRQYPRDSIHVNLLWTSNLSEYVSRYLAHPDGRLCPGGAVAPCLNPISAYTTEDLVSKYDLIDTIGHRYEMGHDRAKNRKPDKLQVEE